MLSITVIGKPQNDLRSVCINHLQKYFETITNNLESLGFSRSDESLKDFVLGVLNCKGIHSATLLPSIYKLGFVLDMDLGVQEEESYSRATIL